MGLFYNLSKSNAPKEAILLRVALGADLLLDGARAANWHWLIGTSRVERLMPHLPGAVHYVMGYAEMVLAGVILVGLLTRLAAAIPIALPILMATVAWSRVQSLQAAQMLDGFVHHGMVAMVAAFLVVKGAGPLSVDGMISSRLLRGR